MIITHRLRLNCNDSTQIAVPNQSQCVSCANCTVALTIIVTVVITALLVAGISVIIHIVVYQCVYKRRLTRLAFGGASQKVEGGDGDAIVYDVVDERVGTALEMKDNEAYGVAKSS